MKQIELNKVQFELLAEFEKNLDPTHPQEGPLHPRIIGYGEMSTVFAFGHSDLSGLAFKRMSLFKTEAEVKDYSLDYYAYHTLLHAAGIKTPDFGLVSIVDPAGKPVLYLMQAMLQPDLICNKLLHQLSVPDALLVFKAILERIGGVYKYANTLAHKDIGFDAQFSNWALQSKDATGKLPGKLEFIYVDTSTPLIRTDGKEHLDAELFLRACPASLVWLVRRFFLQDVLDRYYIPRLVIIDLIANCLKESLPELIQPMLTIANPFLENLYKQLSDVDLLPADLPISMNDIRAYYKEDAFIWRLFQGLRRMERTWRRLLRQPYSLILPGKIKR